MEKLDDEHKILLKDYDEASPHVKKAFKSLLKLHNAIGQKDFYYMVLNLQRRLKIEGSYKLKK